MLLTYWIAHMGNPRICANWHEIKTTTPDINSGVVFLFAPWREIFYQSPLNFGFAKDFLPCSPRSDFSV